MVTVSLSEVDEPRLSGLHGLGKDAFDRISAAVIMFALLPLLAVIALGIRLSGRGPVLFRQVRIGRQGKPFTIRKFRTMRTDAEQELLTVTHLNDCDGMLFKIRLDPRCTRFGRLLRRFSLDELPQLWNVVRGDMSMVGPRPPLPSEVQRYDAEAWRRMLVKPGLTGLWQVSGRSDLPWAEGVRLDLFYVENLSAGLDAVILWKTIAAVLRGRGAY